MTLAAGTHKQVALPRGQEVGWILVGLIIVLWLPSELRYRSPPWELTAGDVVQSLGWGLAFVIAALGIGRPGSRRGIPEFLRRLGLVLLSWICTGLILRSLPEVAFSRAVAGGTAAFAAGWLLLPIMLAPRWFGRFLAATSTVTVLALVARILTDPGHHQPARSVTRIATQLNAITVTHHRYLIDAGDAPGGAIVAVDSGFIVATADGTLHRVDWREGGSRLAVHALDWSVPLGGEGFWQAAEEAGLEGLLRVTDLAVDTSTGATLLLATYPHWSAADSCLSLRIVERRLSEGPDHVPTGEWRVRYDSRPCLSLAPGIDFYETGGRVVPTGTGDVLLSVGDLGLNGIVGPPVAQDTTMDYGKILRIGRDGKRTILSVGHRNPQGLIVAGDGRIWSTEHGPRGGDEINLLRAGGNYGWPLATYGTDYRSEEWPLNEGRRDHTGFIEPAAVFVPAVGISSLVVLGSDHLPGWRGDLLIGALGGERLLHARVVAGTIRYVESWPVDARIRDLAIGSNGNVLAWSDEGTLLAIAPALTGTPGETSYRLCAECHGETGQGTSRGPPLVGVVGRPLASDPDYPYSEALRGLGGRWTASRLDEYLRFPDLFAPGTTMQFGGMEDPRDREALIDYLRNLR